MNDKFSSLHVYKAALDLEKQLCNSTQKTKRVLKYGKVDSIHNDILELIVLIAYSNEFIEERLQYLEEAIDLMKRIMIQFRILLDVNGVSKSGYAALISLAENVVRQLIGWLNSLKNGTAKACKTTAGTTITNTAVDNDKSNNATGVVTATSSSTPIPQSSSTDISK